MKKKCSEKLPKSKGLVCIPNKGANLAEWVTAIHGLAKEKGWHDSECSPLEIHALIHSEVAEATEAVRRCLFPVQFKQHHFATIQPPLARPGEIDGEAAAKMNFKPEGEAIELIDVVMRIMDYFGKNNWDFEKTMRIKFFYNCGRPYRHGKKL